MATNNESNSGLWFLIGAVIVAVAAIVWYLNAGGAPAGGTNVTVEAPAATAPAAPAAPAGGTAETTSSTTTTTTTAPATN
ncbi:hypothetical protein ACFHYO_07630 [Paracoccus panacisoli]|uniref:Dynamin n=1 Tax=Paracoccus panacisoli TaxID=1510163 RepID=A0ABV6T7H1_9RHOB|nr:hypothetical protein [Paracoccus sanguinis]KGJ18684.1 hypothetical protein IX55_11330 [Paracoccus sanguinis]